MIGHDVIPHSDQHHIDEVSTILGSSTNLEVEHNHSDLSHIFEHFQHSSEDKNLTYSSVEKTSKSLTKLCFDNFFYLELEHQELWYANLEKQRFRDYVIVPYPTLLSSHSLRGPPFIC